MTELGPSKNEMFELSPLTNTAKFLSPLVVRKESFPMLRNFGLENVYIDDYGHRNKYTNCLFYLFKPNLNVDFFKFEKEMSNFHSFYDWYELGEKKMFVFKVNPIYGEDLIDFKQNKFTNFSEEFLKIVPLDSLKTVYFDLSKEIYRFSEHLTFDKITPKSIL